jgi:hypothetical protein
MTFHLHDQEISLRHEAAIRKWELQQATPSKEHVNESYVPWHGISGIDFKAVSIRVI